MFQYLPFAEHLHSDELGEYDTYGIKAVDAAGKVLESVSDVSLDGEFVTELCRKCTENQLHPIHLMDVIEDHI